MQIKRYSILIGKVETIVTAVRRSLVIAILSFSPIAVGAYVNSSVMQWAGFAWGVILAFTWLKAVASPNIVETFDDARKLIDKLEREAHGQDRPL